MVEIFLETPRLRLRRITQADFEDLKTILQDKDVMYAWEYEFSDEDVQNWIDKNLRLYQKYNLGYFVVENKKNFEIVGQAALMPDIVNNKEYYEIGYILKTKYWHKGYAKECANALKDYAFNKLNLVEVIFEIRPNNIPSIKVAEALNANISGSFVKCVKGKEMPHLIYKIKKSY